MLPHLPAEGNLGGRSGDLDLREPVGAEENDAHQERQASNATSKGTVEGDDAAELITPRGRLARHQASSRVGWVCRGGYRGGIQVEDEGVGQEGSHDSADTSPSLGEQDADGGLVLRATVDGVWICGALQRRNTETDDKMGTDHASKRAFTGCERHELIAHRETKQPNSHRQAIAALLHQGPAEKDGAGNIGDIVPGGKDGGMFAANAHCYLDVVVHDVEEAVGKTPHEEQEDRSKGDGGDGLLGTEVPSPSGLISLDVEALDALDDGGEEVGGHLDQGKSSEFKMILRSTVSVRASLRRSLKTSMEKMKATWTAMESEAQKMKMKYHS